jgi:formamidopyrimidine-DNA glycosylase
MPELPEVETVRRGLEATTIGYRIVGGEVLLDRTVAYPETSAAFLGGLTGATFRQWRRRGKYLLSDLERADGTTCGFGVHLRMTGQLLWCDRAVPLQKHTRVRLFMERDRQAHPLDKANSTPLTPSIDTEVNHPIAHELRFVDTRTFGQMWWIPSGIAEPEIVTGLQKLGPEPLSDEFTFDAFATALAHRKRPIKNALLDQAIVAGVGNIYADEALFLSGIRSTTLCLELTPAEIEALRQNIVRVLTDSIALGGTTFSDFVGVTGTNGRYGGVARVYNRTGQACSVCQTPIERVRLAGRSAHFCPQCQPKR